MSQIPYTPTIKDLYRDILLISEALRMLDTAMVLETHSNPDNFLPALEKRNDILGKLPRRE